MYRLEKDVWLVPINKTITLVCPVDYVCFMRFGSTGFCHDKYAYLRHQNKDTHGTQLYYVASPPRLGKLIGQWSKGRWFEPGLDSEHI
jgi:hypothetical protein